MRLLELGFNKQAVSVDYALRAGDTAAFKTILNSLILNFNKAKQRAGQEAKFKGYAQDKYRQSAAYLQSIKDRERGV